MIKALLVDDHEVVREGLKQILTAGLENVRFVEARNSQEALQALSKNHLDVVLLDISLPGRSGLDVLEELKKLRPKIPVLILSVFSEMEYAIRAFKMGASGYITKQSASDELVAAVKKVIVGGTYVSASFAEEFASDLRNSSGRLPHETLSHRELQVMQLIAKGKSVKKISSELSLSDKTVGAYRTRVYKKMGLSNDVEITRYALQNHLVD